MNPFEAARQALAGQDSIGPPVLATEQVEPVPRGSTDYEALASSGKKDLDVSNLDHALFLFAMTKVRDCPDDDFMAMGHRHCRYWRRHLDREAWKIVEDDIRIRLRQLKGKQSHGHDQASPAAH